MRHLIRYLTALPLFDDAKVRETLQIAPDTKGTIDDYLPKYLTPETAVALAEAVGGDVRAILAHQVEDQLEALGVKDVEVKIKPSAVKKLVAKVKKKPKTAERSSRGPMRTSKTGALSRSISELKD